MVTKDIIAIKIIRNKPAYYKQGLIEIKISKLFNNSHGNHSSISSSSIAKQGHQHIIKYLDSFIFLGHVCLVFELLSMSLLDVLSQNQFRGLPLSVVQRFCRQILMALVAMEEENVIHCDLKPENILLVPLNIHKQQQQQLQQLQRQQQQKQQQQQLDLKSREEVSAANERIHHPNSVVITAASLKDDEIIETDGVDGEVDDSTKKRDDNSSNIDTTLDDSNSNTTQSNTMITTSTVLPTQQGQTTRKLGVGGGGGMSDVKVIDFGSACFEGKTVFSYIQSRFCKYYNHHHHHHPHNDQYNYHYHYTPPLS
jgi:serine/threonine protein kinase